MICASLSTSSICKRDPKIVITVATMDRQAPYENAMEPTADIYSESLLWWTYILFTNWKLPRRYINLRLQSYFPHSMMGMSTRMSDDATSMHVSYRNVWYEYHTPTFYWDLADIYSSLFYMNWLQSMVPIGVFCWIKIVIGHFFLFIIYKSDISKSDILPKIKFVNMTFSGKFNK